MKIKLDITPYNYLKEKIIATYKTQGLHRAMEVGNGSFVPSIVVFIYLKEETGLYQDRIDFLNKFYNYDLAKENLDLKV